jgi:O-antigen ligase
MTAELVARLGGLVAAGGLVLLVLAGARAARLAGLATWAIGTALFLPLLLPSGHGPLLVAGAGLALLAAAAFGLLFRWKPWALAFLALAAAPARVPVTVGDTSANVLVPLYAIVAGSALSLAWSLWRDGGRRRELGALSWPLALVVLWVGLSELWSNDPKEGAVELVFFFFPFAVLAVALARLPWSEIALAWLCRILVAMALVFGAVGVSQWATRDLFWNAKVMAENAYARFFRVNSLFWDPSMYGRFVVIAILVAVILLLFGPWRRYDVALGVGIVGLWMGLLVSFSQSSFAALIAGVMLAAVLAWRWRAAVAVGLAAAMMIPTGFAAPELKLRHSVMGASSAGLDRATGGRFDLVWNGLRIAADHPLVGVGVGGFKRTYSERFELPKRVKEPASHNTPVTMAAEGGVVGLVLFIWLVAAALLVALRRTAGERATIRVTGIVVGVGLSAVFVHSLSYNAFFEDPMVWGFFALAALAARETASSGPSSRSIPSGESLGA